MPWARVKQLLRALVIPVGASVLLWTSESRATTSNICDQAAARASEEAGVPVSILRAITRTETGRTHQGRFEPWPWATNTAGTGRWFDDKPSAVQHARATIGQGRRNVDIGCFQLNYRWHGHAFTSLEQMFDPVANARYAADFLASLKEEKGNWIGAVGAYHSRTDEHATRYTRRFSQIHAGLSDDRIEPTPGAPVQNRENRFPLLQRSDSRPHLGSLVPLGRNAARSLLRSRSGDI